MCISELILWQAVVRGSFLSQDFLLPTLSSFSPPPSRDADTISGISLRSNRFRSPSDPRYNGFRKLQMLALCSSLHLILAYAPMRFAYVASPPPDDLTPPSTSRGVLVPRLPRVRSIVATSSPRVCFPAFDIIAPSQFVVHVCLMPQLIFQ